MIALLLAGWLAAAAPAGTPEADAAAALASPADCPPAKVFGPRIPVELMRSDRSGAARVRARIDGCGRVLSVELAESSGFPKFDQAALDAVAGFVMPAGTVAAAKNGLVVVPMKFGGVTHIDVQPIDWPGSHRRPRYEADAEPIALTSIDAFDSAVLRAGTLRAPYGAVRLKDGSLVTTWIQRERDDPATWWLHYNTQPPQNRPGTPAQPMRRDALVRYRLAESDGRPVVRVAMLCARPEADCAILREFFMQGLPFAKPARR